MTTSERIIITGATGFVGSHVLDALSDDPRQIVCTSRDPARAAKNYPNLTWAKLDVDNPDTVEALLQKGDRVVYLIHGMSSGAGYKERERDAAKAFGEIALDKGVARIVYLGGPRPQGTPSEHLLSRLETGRILRESGVPTIELQAGMIMGAGSESWLITRDLSARLPIMLLPKWLKNQCEPIAVRDVVAAIVHALDVDDEACGEWGLPGPERMSYGDVIYRVAKLRGTKPFSIPVPLLTPKLSAHWLRLVTRAEWDVARELVEGLNYDLVCADDGYWKNYPEYERMSFDEGAQRALRAEERQLPILTHAAEQLIKRLSRAADQPG